VTHTIKLVSVGSNPELLWLREAVLKAEGYDVFSTSDIKQAAAEIGSGNFSVLLLCYSLPLLVRQQLANKFRKQNSHARVVVITNIRLEGPPVDADAFVYGFEGPEALIGAIRGDDHQPE